MRSTENIIDRSMLREILTFAIPVILTNYIQVLFNMTDIAVVGRFAGSASMAAVGATTAIINFFINFFNGFTSAGNVIVAYHIGEQSKENTQKAISMVMACSIVCGIAVGITGWLLTDWFLALLQTPQEIVSSAAVYLKVYFAGAPMIIIYMFTSALLRAMGDTRRPMVYLMISGGLNIVLNLVFVIIFRMDVAGVALATAISQTVAAVMNIRLLMSGREIARWDITVRPDFGEMNKMLAIGVPAGMNSSMYSISNSVIQSAINSFGVAVVAADTLASNFGTLMNQTTSGFFFAAMTFVGQSYGAGDRHRIRKVWIYSMALAVVMDLMIGRVLVAAGPWLLALCTTDTTLIPTAMLRMRYVIGLYFIVGVMDPTVSSMRAFGKSFIPMVVSLVCIVGARILYIYTVFDAHRSLSVLYMTYPLTWMLASVCQVVLFLYYFKHLREMENG